MFLMNLDWLIDHDLKSYLTALFSLVLLLFSCTVPLISPMCPEPMAKSLSFQSFDNSLSMLGASV